MEPKLNQTMSPSDGDQQQNQATIPTADRPETDTAPTSQNNDNSDDTKASFLGADGTDRIIVKESPARGNLQQFRLDKVATFTCARCTGTKTAKLVAVREGDWTGGGFLCNGCYGWLLANADATWN
ncbi:hypothetical protein QBC37DRAFT_432797 [Rhypophila decipiens]|uniref:Uncharacterized protein n=1 Tax=Rhypophila decipiens TaxID=261697 RepID=A0AAN7B4I0_9PEZI|nr:hypothetical protein QBC37DRAFT_432797 [Rhypophila decipiens]